jgi:lipopolysaccharide transport system permease protein
MAPEGEGARVTLDTLAARADPGTSEPDPVIVITPGRPPGSRLLELWRYRDLVYFLAWRDVKVRYKQTLVGVGWAVLQPLLTMVVLAFVFGTLVGLSGTSERPYPLVVYTGVAR